MTMIYTFSPLVQNGDTGDGKRLVSGLMDSGEPNKQGYLLDYDSSKPYIEKYIAAFQESTNGVSMGAVRSMHKPDPVGKIVAFELDDSRRALPITVRVDDDEAWKKVEACVFTGFSGSWHTVGPMWEDKELTKKHGRKILRYTGDPVEVSLVDVPRVPGCGFQSIENAVTTEGEPMPEPNAEIAPAPASEPKVENGIYTAVRLLEVVEQLSYIHKNIEAEEQQEGQGSEIPDDLKAALSEAAKVAAKYSVAQVAEMIEEGEDFDLIDIYDSMEDAMSDDGVENGDFSGHPFRGNQHAKGRGSAGHSKASAAAAKASASARKGGSHGEAAKAHKAASDAATKAGKKGLAAYHANKAKHHEALSNGCGAGSMKNGDIAPVIDLSKIESALEALGSRLSSIEAQVVSNGAVAPESVPAPVAPAPVPRAPVAVFHDPEQGGASIQNGATSFNPGWTMEQARAHINGSHNN